MKNYLKLLRFIKGHKRVFFWAVFTMLVSSFFEVFQFSMIIPLIDRVINNNQIIPPNKLPDIAAKLIDLVNKTDRNKLLPVVISTFAIVMVLKNILVFFYQYLMGDVSQRIMRDVRYKIYEKIHSLSLDYFSKKRTGELISRITHDVNIIENAVSYAVTDLFRQTFTLIFWIVVALVIDAKAALVIFLIFPVIGIPMDRIGRKLRKISKGIQEKMADMNSLLLETISGAQVVKAFCTEDYENKRFYGQNHDYYKLRMKSIKRLIVMPPMTEVIGMIFGVLVMIWFIRRLMSQEISFGMFGYFMAAIMNLISPVKKLGNVNAITQQALAANDRIYEILDAQPSVKQKAQAAELKPISNSIKILNVYFRYQKEEEHVLKDISLEVKKGELVAIVGPTGVGKTTLVNLIPRFYDPTEGTVSIDGVDLRDVTFNSLRTQIGIVTQETILFNDTVRANICYGRRDASEAEVRQAAERAFAHDFVSKMTDGYNTKIGDRGFRLSGGEKQRIAIARAILLNPPILILDEATSQLDSESEKFVQEALDKLMEGRTVVAIAHRLSTIKKASKILVLEKGKIAGIGKHDELLKTCQLYEKLYRIQFQP
ncbi:MAG: ABC transporter ATP-binding protein [Candidatus Omnitrophica bacterium]|nr:ABC transporter ATP-binding protein [Candidatus Omnitrophota bacterium]